MEEKDISTYDIEETIFDPVYIDWMRQILFFVKKVAVEREPYQKYIKDGTPYSFFGTAESVADQFFYFLMKDEISESFENRTLPLLCRDITNMDGNFIGSEIEFMENLRYMKTICTQNHNAFLKGQIYDFYISMWSCFEAAINTLCLLYEDKISEKLNESNYKKALKFIKKCIEDLACAVTVQENFEQNKEKFIKEFSKYTSFPDRINYLFKYVLKDDYRRDINKDKEILLFCGKLRNTIHNNGINLTNDQEIKIDGHIFKIEKNKKFYLENLIDIMILVNEIFDIYVEIIRSWKMNDL